MTRMDDMLARWGECVTVAVATKIMGRSRGTINRMLDDGRLRRVCRGTMVDVRSIAEYIEAPAEADSKARLDKQIQSGKRCRFSV